MTNGKKEGNAHLIKNTVGGVIGNVLEWYDFAIFGYFAPVIGTQFFPSEDKLAGLIKVFGVFAAGYLMRPLGGMLFGFIGDRIGRKKALEISVLLMALPTTLVGLLPTYAQVGVLAAVLLIILRLAQGVSVGGELIGSIAFITEVSPPKRRGFFGSWTLFSAVGGIMLGSLVAAVMHGVMSAEALKTWGWRVPFLLGIGIGGFSLWMRTGLSETKEFKKSKEEGKTAKNPVLDVVREMPGSILHLAAIVILMGGGFYMLFVWMPTYLSQIVKPHVSHALGVNTAAMLAMMLAIPFFGGLSDRFGRKKIIALCSLGFIILGYPLFMMLDQGVLHLVIIAQLICAMLMAGIQGAVPATMVEMFPTRLRYSGVAIGYNITLAVFGGTSPLICTWLIKATGDIAAPAYYLIAMSAASMIAALVIKDRHREPLT